MKIFTKSLILIYCLSASCTTGHPLCLDRGILFMNKLEIEKYVGDYLLSHQFVNDDIGEIWKDIPGFENLFQVSTIGNVRTLNHRGSNKIVQKKLSNSRGYLVVGLNKDTSKNISLVHRLVAQAFIPNPDNKPWINHINGIKDDNRLVNLEWCTISENVHHSFYILNSKRSPGPVGRCGAKSHSSIPICQYDLSGNFIKEWDSIRLAAHAMNISPVCIHLVCKEKRKTSCKYKWKYKFKL